MFTPNEIGAVAFEDSIKIYFKDIHKSIKLLIDHKRLSPQKICSNSDNILFLYKLHDCCILLGENTFKGYLLDELQTQVLDHHNSILLSKNPRIKPPIEVFLRDIEAEDLEYIRNITPQWLTFSTEMREFFTYFNPLLEMRYEFLECENDQSPFIPRFDSILQALFKLQLFIKNMVNPLWKSLNKEDHRMFPSLYNFMDILELHITISLALQLRFNFCTLAILPASYFGHLIRLDSNISSDWAGMLEGNAGTIYGFFAILQKNRSINFNKLQSDITLFVNNVIDLFIEDPKKSNVYNLVFDIFNYYFSQNIEERCAPSALVAFDRLLIYIFVLLINSVFNPAFHCNLLFRLLAPLDELIQERLEHLNSFGVRNEAFLFELQKIHLCLEKAKTFSSTFEILSVLIEFIGDYRPYEHVSIYRWNIGGRGKQLFKSVEIESSSALNDHSDLKILTAISQQMTLSLNWESSLRSLLASHFKRISAPYFSADSPQSKTLSEPVHSDDTPAEPRSRRLQMANKSNISKTLSEPVHSDDTPAEPRSRRLQMANKSNILAPNANKGVSEKIIESEIVDSNKDDPQLWNRFKFSDRGCTYCKNNYQHQKYHRKNVDSLREIHRVYCEQVHEIRMNASKWLGKFVLHQPARLKTNIQSVKTAATTLNGHIDEILNFQWNIKKVLMEKDSLFLKTVLSNAMKIEAKIDVENNQQIASHSYTQSLPESETHLKGKRIYTEVHENTSFENDDKSLWENLWISERTCTYCKYDSPNGIQQHLETKQHKKRLESLATFRSKYKEQLHPLIYRIKSWLSVYALSVKSGSEVERAISTLNEQHTKLQERLRAIVSGRTWESLAEQEAVLNDRSPLFANLRYAFEKGILSKYLEFPERIVANQELTSSQTVIRANALETSSTKIDAVGPSLISNTKQRLLETAIDSFSDSMPVQAIGFNVPLSASSSNTENTANTESTHQKNTRNRDNFRGHRDNFTGHRSLPNPQGPKIVHYDKNFNRHRPLAPRFLLKQQARSDNSNQQT